MAPREKLIPNAKQSRDRGRNKERGTEIEVEIETGPETDRKKEQTHQNRIHKPHGALTSRNPLLIDTIEHAREDRRRRAGAADQDGAAAEPDDDVVADGRDVRVAAAGAVVDAAVGTERGVIDAFVEGIGWGVVGEVG